MRDRPQLSRISLDSPFVAAALFALAATLSFLVFREPPILSDQLDYFSAAWALPDTSATHRHLRVGLVWPVWALTRIFGYSEFAYYGVPLLTRFLLGFSTWWLGRQMFSARVGWTAGLLLMMTPAYTRVASQLLPDYFAGSLIALSIALIFWTRSGPPRAARTQFLALLASGVCVGWAYLAREYIVILFPCIGLGMLLLRTPLRGWVAFCIGAIATYCLELAWGLVVYGNPLVRFSASASPRETDWEFATEIPEILALLPTAFSQYGGWWLPAFVVFGLIAPIAFLRHRHAGWRVLAAWSLPGWIFFTTIALLPVLLFDQEAVYLRLHMFRYWSIIFPPIFIAGAAAVFALADQVRGRYGEVAGLLLSTLLIAVPTWGTALGLKQVSTANSLMSATGHDYREFRSFMEMLDHPPDMLWMDQGSGVASSNSLPIYLRSPAGRPLWEGTIRFLNSSRSNWVDISEIDSGYVVLDRTRADVIFNNKTPRYFLAPTRVWETVFRSSNGRILVLDPLGSPSETRSLTILHPASLQVRRAGNSGGRHASTLTRDKTLHVQVSDGARVIVTDDAGPGLSAPRNGENLIPAGAEKLVGTIRIKKLRAGGPAPTARCLFYDGRGERSAPWASVSGGVGDGEGQVLEFDFLCPVPQGNAKPTAARVLLQWSTGTDVEILGLEYGFRGKKLAE